MEDFRARADAVRSLPLESVLRIRGATPDPDDRSKWQSEQGPLSITGAKFFNWHRPLGGGGAIDLVMHLADTDCRTAVKWLEQHLGVLTPPPVTASQAHPHRTTHSGDGSRDSSSNASGEPSSSPFSRALQLPVPQEQMLDRVLAYLTQRRGLSADLLAPLIVSDRLYADRRGNAVFLMVTGKPHRPVGAELRGTGSVAWRGMAPGTRKDQGYFFIAADRLAPGAQTVLLCESAIDAISAFQLQPHPSLSICISTSGVRADPRWLVGLLDRGHTLYCGFDADGAGDAAAAALQSHHPSVQRLRPPAKDWNAVLTSS